MRAITIRRIFLVVLLLNTFYQIHSSKVNLTSLSYDVTISSRLCETKVEARFNTRYNTRSNSPLKLLIPENALITSFFIKFKGENHTSRILKKNKVTTSKGKKGSLLLQHRTARAQLLKMETVLLPWENITLQVEYTQLLRRTRGYYHAIMYFPPPESQYVDMNIKIRISGELSELMFLKTSGDEEPPSSIKHGNAEIYAANNKELRFTYRQNKFLNAEFTSVTHNNPTLSEDLNPSSLLSFNPDRPPDLFLADPAFVLSFDVQRYPDGGELKVQNGYFVHFLSPEGLQKLPVHTVFVLDISGSMDELNKLNNLKIAMKTTLRSLRPEDSFEIIVFSTNVKSLGVFSASYKDIGRSISSIDSLRAYGGTNINDALMEALTGANKRSSDNGAKQIVFLTDGRVTVGEMDPQVIRQNVKRSNVNFLPIYALAFGDDTDIKFLRRVSNENRGFTRKIRSEGRPADQLRGFYKEISTPLLSELSVTPKPNEVVKDSVFTLGQDSFYSGDEVVVAGKLKNNKLQHVNLQVKGRGAKGHLQLKVSRKDTLPAPANKKVGIVERLWAYLAVQDLLTAQELVEDNNIRTELRARALEIALKYNFVTRLTTLEMNEDSIDGEEPFHMMGIPASLVGDFAKGLTLVSPEDFAATLPNELQGSVTPSQSRRFSFVDNDPHFVVQVSGLPLPLCFDLHGSPGNVISLIRDDASGLIVNARVSAAIGRPGATYFTEIFISLEKMNLTITTSTIKIECIHGNKVNEVLEVWHESSPVELQRKRTRRRKSWLKRRRRRHRSSARNVRKTRSPTIFNKRSSIIRNKFHYPDEYVSPIIDAYLEKDTSKDSNIWPARGVQIYPGKTRDNHLWQNKSQNQGLLNQYYYQHPMDEKNFIIRSSITITKPVKKQQTFNECQKTFPWDHIARRRYDDVEFTIRGRHRRRRMDIIVGDVNLHVVITNTRNKHKQSFLGFYIQEQKILSPNTTGVIGQFVYKSVETVGHFPELFTNPESHESKSVPLTVIHMPEQESSRPRVNRVTAQVSRRRSLLHKERVLCLHVKKPGRGLFAKRSKKYLLDGLKT